MSIRAQEKTGFIALSIAATLALTGCGGDTEEATETTPTTVVATTVADVTTVPETTTAPTTMSTTAPEATTTTAPLVTTGPAAEVPKGWKVYDPGAGYTIALPPRWVDATDVIKGEMSPGDLPAFEDSSLSPEQLQQNFGAALELMSLFAIDEKAMTENFAPNINVLTTPLAAEIPLNDAKTEFEAQLNQIGNVTESEVAKVGGQDAIRTEFSTTVAGNEAVGVQIAVIKPTSLTVITYTGLEVPDDLDRILNTITVSD